MTFTGVAPAASVRHPPRRPGLISPGTSGLMYWSDYDNIGAYARLFQSLEGPRHLHAPVRRRIGPRRLPPQEYHSIPRVGAVRAITRSTPIIRFGPPLPPLTATGRVVEHPFGSERRVRTLSGLLLAGRHRKFRADRVEQVRPLRLQACFVVDAGAVVP